MNVKRGPAKITFQALLKNSSKNLLKARIHENNRKTAPK